MLFPCVQPFDEGGRRIATPSALTSTIGMRLFSTLDDGTGFTPVEHILDAWLEEGIENSTEILQVTHCTHSVEYSFVHFETEMLRWTVIRLLKKDKYCKRFLFLFICRLWISTSMENWVLVISPWRLKTSCSLLRMGFTRRHWQASKLRLDISCEYDSSFEAKRRLYWIN